MSVFRLPDLGEGLVEAEIQSWEVKAGDTVKQGDTLLCLETDKAIVDIPSPQDGEIKSLAAEAGAIVKVGEPLLYFDGDDDGPDVYARQDQGSVVGRMSAATTPTQATPSAAGRALPAVRKLAESMGIDLAAVNPTGNHGEVTAADLQRRGSSVRDLGGTTPLRSVRRAMSRKMTEAHRDVADVTVTEEADLGDWNPDEDITLRLLRALCAGVAAEAALNAWYDGQAIARRVMENVDVAIAVDTADGLFTPVLRDVANRSPEDLRTGLNRLKADVLARSIPMEELRDYTITLSNYGIWGGIYSDPIVAPPSVAILGAGRRKDKVVAHHGQAVVRPMLPLSLTFDHRCVTGGEATRFLMAVVHNLEAASWPGTNF